MAVVCLSITRQNEDHALDHNKPELAMPYLTMTRLTLSYQASPYLAMQISLHRSCFYLYGRVCILYIPYYHARSNAQFCYAIKEKLNESTTIIK